jgi:hypothetical protein
MSLPNTIWPTVEEVRDAERGHQQRDAFLVDQLAEHEALDPEPPQSSPRAPDEASRLASSRF